MKNVLSMMITLGALAGVVLFAANQGGSETQTSRQLPLDRGLAFVRDLDQVHHDASLNALQQIPRVDSAAALAAEVDGHTTTLLLDAETLDELSSEFLRSQVEDGLSIIAIDVPLATLMERAEFLDALGSEERRASARATADRTTPDEAFYSHISMTPQDAGRLRYKAGQAVFSRGLLIGELALHLPGINADIGVRSN